MLMERMIKVPSSGGYELLENLLSTLDGITHTFSDVSLGVPATNRTIIICVNTTDNADKTILGCTYDGISLTELAKAGGTTEAQSAIYGVEQDTLASAEIIVTMNAATMTCAIHVYRVMELIQGITTVDSNSAQTNSGTGSLDVSVNAEIDDLIIAAGSATDDEQTNWSSAVSVDFDAGVGGGRASVASAIQTVAGAPTEVTVNWPAQSGFNRAATAVTLR